LYKKDGYYYLVTAEGGTEWDHAVTVARSRSLAGPYEVSPHHPLLTSARNPSLPLQKAGHGSFVQSRSGDWYLAHLCSRHGKRRRCILGRETAIQSVTWPKDGWPRLTGGGNEPAASFTVPIARGGEPASVFTDDFAQRELNPQWNTLREPPEATWLSLAERPGFLRLRGRNWLQCLFDQSLVGLRLTHPQCEVATLLEFSPSSFQQAAGLAIYYNTSNFHYLYLTRLSSGSLALKLISSDNRRCQEVSTETVPENVAKGLRLKARLLDEELQFFAATGDGPERPVGPVLDASILSDDYPAESGIGLTFTGTLAVLCAQDSGAGTIPADFTRFSCRAIASADNQPLGKSR
jgi:xylan 1,4-beta-xylosidase